MNTIKLNNTEFEVSGYSKTTYLNGERVDSSASCDIVVTDIANLNALLSTDITSIKIYHDGDLIYNLTDVEGHIANMSEFLDNDRIRSHVNFSFGDEPAPTPSEEPII